MRFRREPSSPEAMLNATAARGWVQVGPPTLIGLQPPALALVDVEDLGGARPTPCEYWAAESPDGMLATHVSVAHDEYDTASYDMVGWDDPTAGSQLRHVELSLRRHGRQHHRLGDRWGAAGSAHIDVAAPDWRMTARRDAEPAALTALAAHPGLADVATAVAGDRGGLRLDVVGERCAVWVLTAGPRRGAARWEHLLDAAVIARAVIGSITPSA